MSVLKRRSSSLTNLVEAAASPPRPASATPHTSAADKEEVVCQAVDLDKFHFLWKAPIDQDAHLWATHDARASGICCRCRHVISRLSSDALMRCTVCHLYSHRTCAQPLVDLPACRPTYRPVINARNLPKNTHHWVLGKHARNQDCSACEKPVAFKFGSRPLTWRCAWCKRVVHATCLEENLFLQSDMCDLGSLKKLILPACSFLLTTFKLKQSTVRRNSAMLAMLPQHQNADRTVKKRVVKHKPQSDPDDEFFPAARRSTEPDFRVSEDVRSLSLSGSPLNQSQESVLPLVHAYTASTATTTAGAPHTRQGSAPSNGSPVPPLLHALSQPIIAVPRSISQITKPVLPNPQPASPDPTRSTSPASKPISVGSPPPSPSRLRKGQKPLTTRPTQTSTAASTSSTDAPIQKAPSLEPVRRSEARIHITPLPNSKPLLVFINPRSGGNKGAKLLGAFQWCLNPRQVFNLMARDDNNRPSGPDAAIELFKDVENLHILVCGGDGTVGWVLEVIDKLGYTPRQIPVAVLPLGTGNDLARELHWGGGYDGLPVEEILQQVADATPVPMDRWSVKVTANDTARGSGYQQDRHAVDTAPQSVFNNYFSIGSDAETALQFHLAREANPKQFDSRMRNKAHYGLLGAKDMIQHKFRNLHSLISLQCDGESYDDVLKRKGIEAVVFLNISNYAAGTRPWGTTRTTDSFSCPAIDDGKLEVVGFESALAMAKGQMGIGHAVRICQCSTALITTRRHIPIQVDGEPCLLAPSVISIGHQNKVMMLRHEAAVHAPVPLHSDIHNPDLVLPVDVYLVFLNQHDMINADGTVSVESSSFEYLGRIRLSLVKQLALARLEIQRAFDEQLSQYRNWRYLRFISFGMVAGGAYHVVPLEEEQQSQVDTFSHSQENVHPGIFVGVMLDDVMLFAAMNGHVDLFREYLLDFGVYSSAVDANGMTALHLAAYANREEIARLLVETPLTDINATDKRGRTALHYASSRGHAAMCALLLPSAAQSLTVLCAAGYTPLDLATHYKHSAVIDLLTRQLASGSESRDEPILFRSTASVRVKPIPQQTMI
eukprot:m.881564 g.881564  ORF g.881564 m.881564 type:complete len:1062 (+) comp59862_c0_seq10:277-3462(+)